MFCPNSFKAQVLYVAHIPLYGEQKFSILKTSTKGKLRDLQCSHGINELIIHEILAFYPQHGEYRITTLAL